MSWKLIWEHLYIVLLSVLLSIAAGLPLGILAYMKKEVRKPILWISDLFQTIPSLALLGLLMVVFGAGKLTVVLGITLYSLLPIVRNTCLGLQELSPALKEAARGCGMSRMEQLVQVELPLAFPTIFTGIRIAAVNAIGTAVFAAFVGGGGLGTAIYQGIRTKQMRLILLPTAALMTIALVFDTLMGRLETLLAAGAPRKRLGRAAAICGAVLLCAALAAGGIAFRTDSSSANTLTLYDGDYSETQLLTQMVKLLVEEHTDLNVHIKDQMTQVNTFHELTAADPSCDLMVSYDGTLLTTFLHQDTTDIPPGVSLYDYANQQASDAYQVHLLGKLGLNNTYAIAVTEDTANAYQLRCISDLLPVADQLIFGAEHGFFTQEGSMKYRPFTDFYGLSFRDAVSVDLGLKYAAIENNSFQVTEVYTTDGLNRRARLRILEDDRHFFPEYNGALLVRDDLFQRFSQTSPQLEETLNLLSGSFTNDAMSQLTYAVDVQGQSVEETARAFLRQQGLLA